MSKSKTIHFMRHAQGLHNINKLHAHTIDPPITDEGIEQCKKVNKDKFVDVELVVVSPFLRTLQTATKSLQSLSESNVPFIALELVREKCNLQCNKRNTVDHYKQLFDQHKINFDNIEQDDTFFENCNNGNETDESLNLRINDFYNWLKDRPEQNIIVVSHGYFLNKVLKNELFNITDCGHNYFKNCEVRTHIVHFT